MPARLQTFGHLRLLEEGGGIVPYPEKALIILAYLHARGLEEVARADIAALLWDDEASGTAFANLRQTLARVLKRQRQLGRTHLAFTETAISLGPDRLESDVGKVREDADVTLLAGLLGEDFVKYVKPGTRALAAWIALQREAQIGVLRHALLRHAAKEAPAERQAITAAALRLLETNPGDEEIRALLTGQPAPAGGVATLLPAVPMAPAEPGAPAPAYHSPPRVVLLPPVTTFASRMAARFAEALVEDVTIGLCSLRSISIIAPHTAAQISRQSDKAATYARHAISYIVETRLHDEGGSHTLFAQLIFFGSDEVIWAERFPLSSEGLLHSRQTIARQVAGTVAARIEQNEFVRGDYERDADAYRCFLIGQSHLKNLDLREVRRARKSFREALQANGAFAPALAGLARSYFLEWLVTARGDGDLLRQAETYAEEAVRGDHLLASGYRELGVVKLYARQFDESAAHLERAEQLSPHYANVIASYADTLVQASAPALGLMKIEQALTLNPLPPDEYFWTAAGANFSLGRYEAALSFIARMKDKAPVHRLSAACWGMLGDTRKARQFVRRTYDVNPNFDLEAWMAVVPFKEAWQREHYREALKKAGF